MKTRTRTLEGINLNHNQTLVNANPGQRVNSNQTLVRKAS